MLSKLYRQYPVVKDNPDNRDIALPAPELTPEEAKQQSVDLRNFCGPVKDQGQTSSCTAHAASSMREFLYRKYYDEEANKTVPPNQFLLSPLYIYYKERAFEGDLNQDGGAQMRTAAKMLNNVGTCLIKDDPFSQTQLFTAPTNVQVSDALLYKSGSYHKLLPGLDTMKGVLKSGYTFIAGITVYSSFEDSYTSRTGVMLMPNISTEQCLGGHALHFVGFDDTKQHLIVQNSWGTSWGDKGFFYMPYKFASDPNLMSDAWINHLGGKWGTPEEIAKAIADSKEPYELKHDEPACECEPKQEDEHKG